ncbi:MULTISPECIES: hypothetical protein [Caballeronia]|jgi:hypothetical protein|uniref:Uncharacterized protein n=1 Tax=Caballeronia zhejiangensis TaxID=871203 RepID=A0A656QQE5_9BURK|nr:MULTISPECIES: hypothetical protein [Caballeronia]EKS66552.1 hypothetical protein BURK_031929 [Burkholderia sp. SJ98]KDR30818.1 hypothetical protein BG60_34295 [Caballeronia zhejiangensis]MDR5790172.1 hypothetical protein [Caballeronia sp. LP003]
MCALTVSDLEYDRVLDHAAMSAISGGGGAPWVFGWITPFVERSSGGGAAAGAITLVDVTNNIYAVTNNITNNVTNITVGQMVNQFQNVAVSNTGNGATLTVSPNSVAGNRAG